MRTRLTLLLVVGLVVAAAAQQFTPIQQTAARLDSAAQVATSATSQATLTLTPNGGEVVYVYEVDVQNCTNATGVAPAAQTAITTTNLTGSPQWQVGSGSNNAAFGVGGCAQTFSISYPGGLRATALGTAVTFVLPTFAAQQTIRLNVAWRSGPAL